MVNIIDVIVILFILLCIVSGFKRGVIKETVNVVGNLVVLILSFSLMGSVAKILYGFMPFFNFGLLGISLSALNLLVYQIIAFVIIYLILSFVFRLVLSVTKVIDQLVNSLMIFHAASSVLGGIVGFIGGFLISFVILIIISVPLADNVHFHESKAADLILNHTPVLTGLTRNITSATGDIYTLTQRINKDRRKLENSNLYNLEILGIMLKYHVVSVDEVDQLVEQGKLSDLKNINSILNQYR